MMMLRKLASALGWGELPDARLRSGLRVYAIGDVHGRLDALDLALRAIVTDLERKRPTRAVLVFMGDLVDRGPNSAGVLERVRGLSLPGVETVYLLGNHEETLLRLLDGERGLLEDWLRFGGDALAQSYGVDPKALVNNEEEQAVASLRSTIPRAHIAFLQTFRDTVTIDDYLFVHAGIRPGVPLEEQTAYDLRWIREPFLSHTTRHERVVVHGHTIVDEPEDRGNRIAIDTGAYRTGRLTTLILEGNTRRFSTVRADASACRPAL